MVSILTDWPRAAQSKSSGGKDRKREKKSKKDRSSKDSKKSKKKKDRKRDSDKDKEKDSAGKGGGVRTGKMMGAVDQNAFGKHGVLRESDYFSKQREFEVGGGGGGG